MEKLSGSSNQLLTMWAKKTKTVLNRKHLKFFRFDMRNALLTIAALFVAAKICLAPGNSGNLNRPPGFDEPAIEQAKRLLRKVQPMGFVGAEVAGFDSTFAANVGSACAITRDQLRAYIEREQIGEWEIGGLINNPVSSVTDASGNTIFAKYFVIHDTSYPRYKKDIPDNIDSPSWEWNNLNRWNSPVCHLFVNRIGQSKTITPFDGGMTATKMERYILGDGSSRGLYLHIELIQPRAPNRRYGRHNDIEAPTPGFSAAQYKRLALLYVTASVRKGEWLIPGFHACIDHGIRNAHDDPQNFELHKFLDSVNTIIADVSAPTAKHTSVVEPLPLKKFQGE